ncbi:hypothetical protein RB593_009936 [Gaeumannomyces tritici]
MGLIGILTAPVGFPRPQYLWILPALVVVASLTYYTALCIYNLYFHPLSKYPGPRLAAATPFWLISSYLSGKAHVHISEAHERYGPVVRTTPGGLSYINPQQWKEIYGHKAAGQPEFGKQAFASAVFEEPTLHNADREYHGYVRRLFHHGFSERALAAQQAVFKSHVDRMFEGIERESQGGSRPVNIMNWYNFLTFDFIGFLTFGESFDCLRTSSLHDWIKLFMSFGKLLLYGQVLLPFPRLLRIPIALWLIPAKLREDRRRAGVLQAEKLKYRLSMQPKIPDFTEKMVEAYNQGKMSFNQLEGNSTLLIGAGSETTAAALAGSRPRSAPPSPARTRSRPPASTAAGTCSRASRRRSGCTRPCPSRTTASCPQAGPPWTGTCCRGASSSASPSTPPPAARSTSPAPPSSSRSAGWAAAARSLPATDATPRSRFRSVRARASPGTWHTLRSSS